MSGRSMLVLFIWVTLPACSPFYSRADRVRRLLAYTDRVIEIQASALAAGSFDPYSPRSCELWKKIENLSIRDVRELCAMFPDLDGPQKKAAMSIVPIDQYWCALAAVETAATDADPGVRIVAAGVLERFGDNIRVLRRLEDLLSDPDADVRVAAESSLRLLERDFPQAGPMLHDIWSRHGMSD